MSHPTRLPGRVSLLGKLRDLLESEDEDTRYDISAAAVLPVAGPVVGKVQWLFGVCCLFFVVLLFLLVAFCCLWFLICCCVSGGNESGVPIVVARQA